MAFFERHCSADPTSQMGLVLQERHRKSYRDALALIDGGMWGIPTPGTLAARLAARHAWPWCDILWQGFLLLITNFHVFFLLVLHWLRNGLLE